MAGMKSHCSTASAKGKSSSHRWLAGLMLMVVNTGAALTFVERPDVMHEHMLADAGRVDDPARVLYQSMPSLAQAASGDWTVNVYVAELYADGRVENRRLASGQRNFSSLLLQRGGDGVFAIATPERKASSATLEYWSAVDGSLNSSFVSAALVDPGGIPWPLFPTDDGNFFVVAPSAQTSAGDQATTLTWTKFSPAGEELAKGQWSNPTAVTGVAGGYPAPDGGMAMTLDLRVIKGVDALQTEVEAVQHYQVGDRTLEARVFSETRLLTADASGAFQWLSPALERDLMWGGEMAIPQDLPANEILAQNVEQMALVRTVTLENGGERRITHQATVGRDDVQLTPNGFGMLVEVTTDRGLDPPLHGTWYIEIGHDGTIVRETRLEPAAELLQATFERFLPIADGGLLVAGIRRSGNLGIHVTAIDTDGGVKWTTNLEARDVQLHGLTGTGEAPWAFGQAWSDAHGKNLLWVERVDPGSADRLAAKAPATATTPRPRPRATPEVAASPALALPEPAEGCACTCEEFEAIQEAAERMKSASQTDVMTMVADPAFQARMNCTAGCAMQYANCR